MPSPPLPPAPRTKRRLGELLIEAGLIDELQLKAALQEQRKWGGKLGRTLVEMGFADEQSIVLTLSMQLGFPPVDLDRATLPPDVTQHLRVDIAERYGIFPLGANPAAKVLKIASSDPTNQDALQEISFNTGMKLQVCVATASAIDRAIRHRYYGESVTSSAVTTPQELGVSEATFDLQTGSNHSGATEATRAPAASAVSNAAVEALNAKVGELEGRVAALEKLVANQVRAMRGMLEIMVEKRMLTREEWIAKVRGQK